jgi:PII-like signaling protein
VFVTPQSENLQEVFSGLHRPQPLYVECSPSKEAECVLIPGPAKKITIHLNEDTSARTDYLSGEIVSLLLERGVAGATVLRPEAGFGSHHRIHTQEGGIDTNLHMPLRIEFIDTEENVRALLPLLQAVVTDGVIESQDTMILQAAIGTAR